ncbi:MAG: hypothetical protein ABIB93_06145 [Chloroflexota bacterium]
MRAEASGGILEIDADGFQRNGKIYVNDAFGRSEATLHICITGGVGRVIPKGDGCQVRDRLSGLNLRDRHVRISNC